MKKLVLLSLSVSIAQALELNVSGVLTGYSIYTNNRVGNDKKTRYDIGSALISISKTAQPVGFTLISTTHPKPAF
ncbi:MAG: hypothetical protein ACPLRS_00500 [Hydrogenobacter sp.]